MKKLDKQREETGENIKGKCFLFKSVWESVWDGVSFTLRECPDQMRDGWSFVGDVTDLIQKEREEALLDLRKQMSYSWYEMSEDKNTDDWLKVIDEYLSQTKGDKK